MHKAAIFPLILLAAFIWVASALGSSARAQCPPPPPNYRTQYNIQVVQPKIVYRHDVDVFGLPKVRSATESAPKGYLILGLTHRVPEFAPVFYMFTMPSRDGRTCTYMARIEGMLGDPEMDVYIAANYPEGSCEYNAIMAHENTHVLINLLTMRAWIPSIKAALNEAVARKFPIISNGPLDPHEIWNVFLKPSMASTIAQMNGEMNRRNGYIDTPENYARNDTLCHHFITADILAHEH